MLIRVNDCGGKIGNYCSNTCLQKGVRFAGQINTADAKLGAAVRAMALDTTLFHGRSGLWYYTGGRYGYIDSLDETFGLPAPAEGLGAREQDRLHDLPAPEEPPCAE